MKHENGIYHNEQMPICKLCNWHAEMQWGSWRMCKHQREEEELIEATKFVIAHIKQDYVQSWSQSFKMIDGKLTEYRTHIQLDDPEQDGLFCDWCGRTGIGEEPIEHAMDCMKTPGWEKTNAESREQRKQRACGLCKKDITDLPDARTNCEECDDKMHTAFLEQDDHHPEEEHCGESPPPEYYEEHYDMPPEEHYEEQEPPPDYGHDEPEDEPPHEEGGPEQ